MLRRDAACKGEVGVFAGSPSSGGPDVNCTASARSTVVRRCRSINQSGVSAWRLSLVKPPEQMTFHCVQFSALWCARGRSDGRFQRAKPRWSRYDSGHEPPLDWNSCRQRSKHHRQRQVRKQCELQLGRCQGRWITRSVAAGNRHDFKTSDTISRHPFFQGRASASNRQENGCLFCD